MPRRPAPSRLTNGPTARGRESARSQQHRLLRSKAALVGLFAVSRFFIYPHRPFRDTLGQYMQFLDPAILRHDLAGGIAALHTQPPLFNVVLGVILKIVPENHLADVFSGLYFLMGIGIVCLLHDVLIRFAVNPRVAFTAGVVTMFLPSMTSAERWLFYAYPLAFLLLLGTTFIQSWARSVHYPLFPFLVVSSAIVLSRGAFHVVVWLAPMCVFLGVTSFRQKNRSSIALIAATLLVSTIPYCLNLVRYGVFGPSTWQGMNLAGMTAYIPAEEIERMIALGKVTPLVRIPRFSPPEVYLDYYQTTSSTGVAALDQIRKSTGAVNWNHSIYPRAAREYQGNTLALMRSHSIAYLKAVGNEAYLFFGLVPYLYFWNADTWVNSSIPALSLDFARHIFRLAVFPMVAALGFVVALGGVAMRAVRRLRSDPSASSARSVAPELFIVWTLMCVFAVSVLFELGEGCYFRMPIDPLIVIGVSLSARRGARAGWEGGRFGGSSGDGFALGERARYWHGS